MNTMVYEYLEKKIRNTNNTLELLDLGYDIHNSKMLTGDEIKTLCGKIDDKLNKKYYRKRNITKY